MAESTGDVQWRVRLGTAFFVPALMGSKQVICITQQELLYSWFLGAPCAIWSEFSFLQMVLVTMVPGGPSLSLGNLQEISFCVGGQGTIFKGVQQHPLISIWAPPMLSSWL